MSVSLKLSQFLDDLHYEDLPENVITLSKHCLIDYLGACWTAQTDPLTKIYRQVAVLLGGEGEFKIIGGLSTGEAFAAMANGAIGHIKEVDDLQRESTMHVAITIFPTLLALSQAEGFDAKKFILSTVCGYETAIRIGQALGKDHYKIFHTTGTAGAFGAAAAAAKYMALEAEQISDALGHAGTQAAGLWQFLEDGAVGTKPLHPGKAAMNGLISACLAKQGIHGSSHILEGNKGFGKIASPNSNMEKVLEGLGTGFKIEQICFKNYPCCGQTHSMLDALKIIMEENNLSGKDIAHVNARVYQQALDLTSNPHPNTLAEARFSLPLCMGKILASGDLQFSDMSEKLLKDSLAFEQAKKVKMVFDDEIDKLFPQTRPCIIEVIDVQGNQYSKKNLYRRGDPEKPMNSEDISKKFKSLTFGILTDEVQEKILKWGFNLENESVIPEFIFSGNINI